MPRYEQENEQQTVVIFDNKAEQDVKFTHREPTTKEREAYDNASMKRKGKKVKFHRFSALLDHGLRLIEGVSDGYLDRGTRKNPRPISSDPESPQYDAQWKAVLKKVAPEIVVLFGAYVFEGRGEVSDSDENEGDGGADTDAPGDDAEKNLPGTSAH